RGRGKRRRPRPQLVHGMPPRPVEGRIPARQRLGCCRRVSALDADGWHEVLHQQETRPTITSVVPPAVQRLAQFLDEVQVVREPPLIASPPRQSTRTRRPLPIRHRSRRITAQPLAHIPASKRGEVLLMQRLRIAPWTALVSPVPK
ncbi:hypothetical protein BDA96_10G304700, partial [Sorghum bicolor]